ncbi:unnamed protein product [Haemonchus placei]|uniref:AGC-kinase C-terminal domain-containing protein n=1 Tax=Haemonchus placei TaxID=6290 RepID=A0A0N4XAJ8_HAEPC|nr:unnamed protein product [Haemonchus placei]
MRPRLRSKTQFTGLKSEGRLRLKDTDKANASAAEFQKSFSNDDDRLPPFAPPSTIYAMDTFPYFDPKGIYDTLIYDTLVECSAHL